MPACLVSMTAKLYFQFVTYLTITNLKCLTTVTHLRSIACVLS